MATSWWGRSPGNRGTRRILVGNAKAKQNRHKGRLSTVMNSLWNGHSRGNTTREDGSEVVQCPCKGGKATGTYGSSGIEHNLGYEKPRITKVRRSSEDGDQWNRWWEVRIEPKETTKRQLRIEPRIQHKMEPRVYHNDTRKRNVTISPISWVSMGHKRN